MTSFAPCTAGHNTPDFDSRTPSPSSSMCIEIHLQDPISMYLSEAFSRPFITPVDALRCTSTHKTSI